MFKGNQEIDMKRQVKSTVEGNVFYKYSVHVLITQNTESGEPE